MVTVNAAGQADFKQTQIAIPAVMTAPVRADIVVCEMRARARVRVWMRVCAT
jgi:hypothetical protein